MIKIYLDNNIYRLLAKPENSSFKALLERNINKNILILYSQAHINDLHQDMTEKKYSDLDFMDSLVEDNYLIHDDENDSVKNSLVRPREAYKHFKPEVESFESFISSTIEEFENDSELKHLLAPIINSWKSIPIDLGVSKISMDQDPKNIVDRLGLSKDPKSLYEWMPIFGKMLDQLKTDHSIIKDIRSLSKNMLQVEKFNINIEDVDFNKNLAETQLGMSFNKLLDTTIDNMTEQEKKNYRYMKFTMAFTMLNFLGLDKEKNKKVKFSNTQHDAEHFFYSTLADWVVSNDLGLINKAKFLINLFRLDLEILNFDQFKAKVNLMLRTQTITAQELVDEISNEFSEGIILNSRLSIGKLQKITVIKPRITILKFFNRISHVEMTDGSSDSYIVLYKDGRKVYHFNWYKDFKSMTNKLVEILGIDDFGYGLFSKEDQQAIKSNEWYGRTWKLGNLDFTLSKNIESYRLNLVIGPYNKMK